MKIENKRIFFFIVYLLVFIFMYTILKYLSTISNPPEYFLQGDDTAGKRPTASGLFHPLDLTLT
jgi:hypothetical protein